MPQYGFSKFPFGLGASHVKLSFLKQAILASQLVVISNSSAKCQGEHFNVEHYTLELDIGRSVYHFLQYIYIPTRYTMLHH